jgi:hypothetical protein
MTIQSLFLNPVTVTKSAKFNFLNSNCCLILFSSCCSLLLTPSAIAQTAPQISEQLPPPPPLSPRSRLISGNRVTRGSSNDILPPANIEPPLSSNSITREYTFEAPNTIKNESATVNMGSYRVEVLGSSDLLLAQVRSIEPQAFLKGEIIQVGIFSEPDNAAELVRQLALQGLWARIVTK